jgi:peptidoglycan glycosyltransferase
MAAVDALVRNMPVVNGTQRTRGAAVVLDPWSGDILATVSLPSYDPNAMTEADLERVYAAEDHPAYDRARDQVYPPGSTFKLVTAAAALEERWLERPVGTTSYTCRHTNDVPWEIGGVTHRRRVTDDELETAHGTIDLRRALVESCNVYFAWLGTRLGAGPLFRVAHDRLGLALKDVAQASDLEANLPDNAYGQARITVSPIEMARVAGAIVNGGYGLDASLYLDRPKVPGGRRRVLRAATAARLREWMIDVVREGTGRRAAVPGLVVGGKTGTAQSAGDASHAWFVGFAFPDGSDDHGAVAFAFLIENGGYGGLAAAQAAHDFLARAFSAGPAAEGEGSR